MENIGGAGASLGAATVARARPDGYTILLGGTLPHVNEVLLKTRPLYDPNKDLDPIMQLAVGCLAIAVRPLVPAKSLDELVKYTKGNPGKVSYGHVGIGSQSSDGRTLQVRRRHSRGRANPVSRCRTRDH